MPYGLLQLARLDSNDAFAQLNVMKFRIKKKRSLSNKNKFIIPLPEQLSCKTKKLNFKCNKQQGVKF